jgi:(p)ppGpp synthase/HD superfamily hydrolase
MVKGKMNSIIEKAKLLASIWHMGQVRKYTGEPYINHCKEVAEILKEYHASKEQIAAGWLHDTIEDTALLLDDLRQLDTHVASLVAEVTHITKPEDAKRNIRKRIERDRLALVSGEAQTIKYADIISNTSSIAERDPEFAKIYLAEVKDLLSVMKYGYSKLRERAKEVVQQAEDAVKKEASCKLKQSKKK